MTSLRERVRLLFEEYKFVRRAALLWVVWLVTSVFFVFAENYEKTGTAQATVIVSFIGLIAVTFGLYQWDKDRDRNRDAER